MIQYQTLWPTSLQSLSELHWIEIERPEDFNAENETNNEIDNEQLIEEIEEKNIDNQATSPTFMENGWCY